MKSILELVLRCKYCKREMKDAIGYAENPFCNVCLNERIEKTSDGRSFVWSPPDESKMRHPIDVDTLDSEARRDGFFRTRVVERKRSPDKL